MSTYHRTVIEVELLTDSPITQEMDMEQIAYEMTYGHASGMLRTTVSEEVTPQEMAKLLQAQASDPSFLGLDADGNEVED